MRHKPLSGYTADPWSMPSAGVQYALYTSSAPLAAVGMIIGLAPTRLLSLLRSVMASG